MGRIFILLSIVLYANLCFAQNINIDSAEVSLDLLKAPSSPAATLIGISESEIPKINDVTDFVTTIRQATNNFSSLPLNFGFEFSPAWIFAKENVAGKNFINKTNIAETVWQSLTLCGAVNNNDIQDVNIQPLSNTALGFGLKFSLARGKVSDETKNSLKKSELLAQKFNEYLNEFIFLEQHQNIEWIKIENEIREIINITDSQRTEQDDLRLLELMKMKDVLDTAIVRKVEFQAFKEKFQLLAKNTDFNRIGFKMDFNSAISYNFTNQTIPDNNKISKGAIWLAASYEMKHFNILALGRYLYHNDNIIVGENMINSFDAGIRLIIPYNKFSISGELINRSKQENETKSNIKYQINFEYKVDKNAKLTYSFGKDFNNSFNQDGNLISALNFIKGFGSKRPVGSK